MKTYYITKKEKICASVCFTLFWWIVAHGFAFTSLMLSHDSLFEFVLFDSAKDKIELGRFFEPLLRLLMGEYVTIPWITAIVSIMMLSIAVFLTFVIFELKSVFEMAFLSGVYVANITLTSTIATYSHDLAGDMVALALSVYVTYLWVRLCQQFNWKAFLLSVLSISALLGFYQAYLSVTIVLVIIYSIIELLRSKHYLKVIKDGLFAIVIIAIGFIIYMILVKTCCVITGIGLNENSYNSLSNLWTSEEPLFKKIVTAYKHVIWTFVAPTYAPITKYSKSIFMPNVYNLQLYIRTIANSVLALLDIVSLCVVLSCKKIKISNKLLILLLVIILPIGMEISYIGSAVSHDLMHYSYWLFYLLSWLLVKNVISPEKMKRYSLIVAISVLIFIICNVQTSNLVYVKKEILKDSTLSTMTRVLYKIEDIDEYDNNTYIAFIGNIDVQKEITGTHTIDEITGVDSNSQITYQGTYKRYFKNILQYDINVCSDSEIETLKENETVKEMPVFPEKGSVKLVDGIIVVKFSNDE